jgi:hypothetical protein
MVRLLNLRKEGNFVFANYCYNDDSDLGYIVYDLEKHVYVEIKYNKRDAEYRPDGADLSENASHPYGFAKTRRAIEHMASAGNFLPDYRWYWY